MIIKNDNDDNNNNNKFSLCFKKAFFPKSKIFNFSQIPIINIIN